MKNLKFTNTSNGVRLLYTYKRLHTNFNMRLLTYVEK